MRSIIQGLGLKIITWNVDTNDWQYVGKPEGEAVSGITKVIESCITGCSSKNSGRGGISLEHDYPHAFAIGNVLDVLSRSSFNLKTVSECVGFDSYNGDWLARILGEDLPLPPAQTTISATSTTTTINRPPTSSSATTSPIRSSVTSSVSLSSSSSSSKPSISSSIGSTRSRNSDATSSRESGPTSTTSTSKYHLYNSKIH